MGLRAREAQGRRGGEASRAAAAFRACRESLERGQMVDVGFRTVPKEWSKRRDDGLASPFV